MSQDTAGQSLAEIVVSVGVIALLVTGVIVATTQSLRNSRTGRVRSLAVQAAQEGIELTRDLRNAGWSDFQAYSGEWCLDEAGVWTPALEDGVCLENIDDTYARSVTFTWNPTDKRMEVQVWVTWFDDADVLRSTTMQTYLTDWK